jgi:hypothetical protein
MGKESRRVGVEIRVTRAQGPLKLIDSLPLTVTTFDQQTSAMLDSDRQVALVFDTCNTYGQPTENIDRRQT